MEQTNSALSNVKVADFSWAAAAPITTKNLADYGATVVRVESRTHLDSVRITGPFPNDKPGLNTSGFYADFNCSKFGMALNLKHAGAADVARKLIAWSDIVVESFTPGTMDRWGLAYDDIIKFKPDIIMLSSSMQGQTGPYHRYSGYGSQGAALAGLHHLTGWSDRPPAGPKGAYTDAIAPRYSIVALLAALDYRERTGEGQYIDLSQVEAAISGFLGPEILDFTVNERIAQPKGNRSNSAAPHGVFPCRGEDCWITIAVENDQHWHALREIATKQEWSADPRFATFAGRLAHQDELEEKIASWTISKDAFEFMEELQAAGVPSGVVQKACDLFKDPQLSARGHFRPLDHVEMGSLCYNGPAHELSETPARLRWAAPLLGEHTTYVLKELLNYTDKQVETLRAQGVLE